jgi:pilus assembly protein CpaB
VRRTRTILILALALVSGGLAAYTTMRLLQERAAPLLAAEPPSSRQMVVAGRDLEPGELLSEQDVKLVSWPGGAVPEGYAQSVAEVVGRGVITRVAANEPLLDAKLADRSGGGGLAITIPEGMRAMSVRVDEVIGVAGYVIPGTRVDVLLTILPDGNSSSQNATVSKVVLQNVQALSAGQVHSRDPEGKPITATVLTVLVSPEDAEKLALASGQGRIQLALRNMIDVKEVRTDGARVNQLLTGVAAARRTPTRSSAAPAAAEQPSSATTVEVIKGGARALIRF